MKVKSLTAKQIPTKFPSVKKELWGGEFWYDCFYVSTIGEHADETVIREYIKNQGKHGKYKQLHKEKLSNRQLSLFNN
jgi:REP element-mobilizing transposase RayT